MQYIFQIRPATFIIPSILFGSSGNSGAGGNIGSSISISGINDGNSGNVGGSGKIGISGKSNNLISTQIDGGSGKLGISGRLIFTGWKLNSGKIISNHISILDKSIVIFGNLKFGIWIIGSCIASHKNDNLQEY
ncbi:hypothetical protein IJL65_00260 [bacterium]|nr:hypothetical protein [bacterium]